MKHLAEIAKSQIHAQGSKYVDFVVVIGGWKKLDPAVNADDLPCPVCNSTSYIAPYVDMDKGDLRRVRICTNVDCPSTKKENIPYQNQIPSAPKRAIEWDRFCQAMGLGDIYHDITFEKIEQSVQKIDFMRKFCHSPKGILYMMGPPGTGKSYACLGICELYTRTNSSIKFCTFKQLLRQWTESFTNNNNSYYTDKLVEYDILIIDDFGTGDISSAFVSFLLDVINSRMQWKNRGTVINTNLTQDELVEKCKGLGSIEALLDRLNTGQIMLFKNQPSRRLKAII